MFLRESRRLAREDGSRFLAESDPSPPAPPPPVPVPPPRALREDGSLLRREDGGAALAQRAPASLLRRQDGFRVLRPDGAPLSREH